MSEEFTEENIDGQIISDEEHEGIRWGNIFGKKQNISKPSNNFFNSIFKRPPPIVNRPAFDFGAIQRAQQEAANKSRAEQNRIQNLENQVRQLEARISQLEGIIRNKDILIEKKTKHIKYLTNENTRLRKKVNSLLDNLQYFRSLVLGNDKVDGYKTTVVKQQIENETLRQQEIGSPIVSDTNTKEGYINQSSATYNAVFSQNQTVKNQIEVNTNDYSVDNQLSSNIISKTMSLKKINLFLIAIFMCVFLYGVYKIYINKDQSIQTKVTIIVLMFLTIFILHSIEYIVMKGYPYISSLIIGLPYSQVNYWDSPGIYDYLPTPTNI
jgi:membrane-associated HD superfamily phosphohydrolase